MRMTEKQFLEQVLASLVTGRVNVAVEAIRARVKACNDNVTTQGGGVPTQPPPDPEGG